MKANNKKEVNRIDQSGSKDRTSLEQAHRV